MPKCCEVERGVIVCSHSFSFHMRITISSITIIFIALSNLGLSERERERKKSFLPEMEIIHTNTWPCPFYKCILFNVFNARAKQGNVCLLHRLAFFQPSITAKSENKGEKGVSGSFRFCPLQFRLRK